MLNMKPVEVAIECSSCAVNNEHNGLIGLTAKLIVQQDPFDCDSGLSGSNQRATMIFSCKPFHLLREDDFDQYLHSIFIISACRASTETMFR